MNVNLYYKIILKMMMNIILMKFILFIKMYFLIFYKKFKYMKINLYNSMLIYHVWYVTLKVINFLILKIKWL